MADMIRNVVKKPANNHFEFARPARWTSAPLRAFRSAELKQSSSRDPSAGRNLKNRVLAGGSNKLKVRLGIRNLVALPVLAISGHRLGEPKTQSQHTL